MWGIAWVAPSLIQASFLLNTWHCTQNLCIGRKAVSTRDQEGKYWMLWSWSLDFRLEERRRGRDPALTASLSQCHVTVTASGHQNWNEMAGPGHLQQYWPISTRHLNVGA